MHGRQGEKQSLEEVDYHSKVLICNFGQTICKSKLGDSSLMIRSDLMKR